MLPALYPRLHSYRQIHTKSSSSMVRYRMQPIGLKLSLDAASKFPTIIVTKQKPQVLPSSDDEVSYEISNEDFTFHIFEGDYTIKCSVTCIGNRVSIYMDYGGHFKDRLHVESSSDPRRIVGRLMANNLAAGKIYYWIVKCGSDLIADWLVPKVTPVALNFVNTIGTVDSYEYDDSPDPLE
ncbi:hypothetical protein LINGRAPRIM_LOCUS421 [Linum grandiflorum]